MAKVETNVGDNVKSKVAAKARKLKVSVAEYLRGLIYADLKRK